MSGPCLTDAAPETAPGGLFVRESRYAEARTSTSAVAAAVCVGGVISTSLFARAMTQGHRHPGRQNQCLADNKACQPYRSRHAAPFLEGACGGSAPGLLRCAHFASLAHRARYYPLDAG
jgi:hypothetical protein